MSTVYKTVVVSKLGVNDSPWRLINYVCSIEIVKNTISLYLSIILDKNQQRG